MNLIKTQIDGCFELQPEIFDDARGRFVKIFHSEQFEKAGLETEFKEEYYSVSGCGVLRGLHFQLPPEDHVKMVYCVSGEVFDVVVDLRVGSPTYKVVSTFKLSAQKANCIYIPKGMAHGFCVTSDSATLVYRVGTVHSPNHDSGILWNSVDVNWPIHEPLISARDLTFQKLENFQSPFSYLI